jgi:hypothetical protein
MCALLLLLQAEQLEHWQRNRRQLAFSTVGTPDYIAPEVRRCGRLSYVGTRVVC